MVEGMNYRDVKVQDILNEAKHKRSPPKVLSDTPLKNVIDVLIENEITRKVYVVNNEDKVIGIITLETLLRHTGYVLGVRKTGVTSLLRKIAEISNDLAKDIMSAGISVSQNDSLVDVAKIMIQYHLNDLPVVDENGRLIGELNGVDILRVSRQYWA